MFIISTCVYATLIYCYTVLSEWMFRYKKTDVCIQFVNQPMIGPSNLNEVCYKFRNRTYRVIIDTDRTNVDTFITSLTKMKLPFIPNRAISSKCIDIDIEKFNEYLGPTCDFHLSFIGIYIPYTIDYFLLPVQSKTEKNSLIMIDTFGCHITYTRMSSLRTNKWCHDCTELKYNNNKPHIQTI